MKIPEYGKIDLVSWATYQPGRGQPAHSSTPSINRAARAPLPAVVISNTTTTLAATATILAHRAE